jgi:hypothetical protein
MRQTPHLVATALVITLAVAGCSRQRPQAPRFQLKFVCLELLKDDQGTVKETGNRGASDAFPAGGQRVSINNTTVEVTHVDAAKATFRVANPPESREVQVAPGEPQDVWLGGSSSGIRVTVELIRPEGG